MMVPPGFSKPFLSASSTILMPMRSFTEPPGLSISALIQICGFKPDATRFRRISGVFPTASMMLLQRIFCLFADRSKVGHETDPVPYFYA
jgi:hypothetical protein